MFITDKLLYVEFQKSGATDIKSLLKKTVGGENDAKNDVPTPEQHASGKVVMGSMIDPWRWYLALWLDGCLQKGELYERLTNPKKWRRMFEVAAAAGALATSAPDAPTKLLPAHVTPERAKTFWYADPDNAEAFREWLHAMLSVPQLRRVIESGYGRSPIGRVGGSMTFRYFESYTRDTARLDSPYITVAALKAHDAEFGFAQHFVHHESLPADLIKALEASGYELTDAQRETIREAKRRNVSNRPRGVAFYYDAESATLVGRRERFIVEKFNYKNKKPKASKETA